MTARPEHLTRVRWEMDAEQSADLVEVLGLLEDFLRHASYDAVEELTRFPLARPLDPAAWAGWLADYIGDQTSALLAAQRLAATYPAATSTSTGDPR